MPSHATPSSSASSRGPADAAAPAADRPIAEMQVLVADDHRDGADVLSALIQLELGCQVVTAYDGRQALQLARASHRDVLILDLEMPHLGGLEVARRTADESGPAGRPLTLAMTGRRDLFGDLEVLDACFDRAFAKPLDHASLFATLRAHWRGAVASRPAVSFRFFDTFTRAAREVATLLVPRRQQLTFDGEGPELTLLGDEIGLHTALYRLMCGSVDLMGSGIVMFSARSAALDDADDANLLTVNLAGSGRLEAPARTAEVLQRLGLAVDADTGPDTAGGPRGAAPALSAHGLCSHTGGRISFVSQPSEGLLLRLEMNVQPAELAPAPRADGARAWIVDPRELAAAVLQRRLQRLGWRVWRFATPTDAARHLAGGGEADRPELLLVREDSPSARPALLALRNRLPRRTNCLWLVDAGSATLGELEALPGCEVRVEPLSPAELSEATLIATDADAAHPGMVTVSHSLQGRRTVLVVDDHEVNRIVATGLLQALGCEVAAVADGLDAIEHCKHAPPDAVLMDLDMPVLGGIDASRRLLELQRLGRVAPFAIVAATADDTPETKARCREAGLGGYLVKPLRLEQIRDELRRVGVLSTAAARP